MSNDINNKNDRRTAYCFLGLPASGKGTQAELLAKKTQAIILGMGDMIRSEIAKADMSDPFYKSIKERYNKGMPQPDEIVADIIKKNINQIKEDVVLDNFPFSINQTTLFFQLCKDLNIYRPVLIVIEVSKEEALKRMLSRKVCSDCGSIFIDDGNQICEKCGGALVSRVDDNEEVLTKRVTEYIPRMEEVKIYFSKYGKVFVINGEQTIEEVEKEINSKVFDE